MRHKEQTGLKLMWPLDISWSAITVMAVKYMANFMESPLEYASETVSKMQERSPERLQPSV